MRSQQVNMLISALPPFLDQERLLVNQQTTNDIITSVLNKHIRSRGHYDNLGMFHWKGTPEATARHLYSFLRKETRYKEEPTNRQTVKVPAAILKDGLIFGNDCKHYAGYINGVGEALKRRGYPIECMYRFAAYPDAKTGARKKIPRHVFAVWKVNGREIWIDPVPNVGGFNSRNPYPFYFIDKKPPMSNTIGALYDISGVSPTTYVSGLNWLDTYFPAPPARYNDDDDVIGKAKKAPKAKKPKKKHKKLQPGKLLKKFGAAAPRNAYLLVLKLNLFNRAVKLYQALKGHPERKKQLEDLWRKWGGNTNKLSTAIQNGVNTHNKLHPKHKVSGFDDYMHGYEEMSGYDEALHYHGNTVGYTEDGIGVAAAGAAAIVAAAAPIIAAVSNIFKGWGAKDAGDEAIESAAADADSKVADDHNGATSTKGDGNKDINDDGSVDHGNGVSTHVETDPATGKQVIKYDVKDPVAGGGGDGDSGDDSGGKGVGPVSKDNWFKRTFTSVSTLIKENPGKTAAIAVGTVATVFIIKKLATHKTGRRR